MTLKLNQPESRHILGVRVDDVSLEEAINLIETWASTPVSGGRLVVTANPEYVMAARRDPAFRELINQAALVTPDGVGLMYAGRFLKQPFRERVTGVAMTHALARRSAETGLSLFLLGAAPGVAESAAEKFLELYPGVKIAGCWAGQAGLEGDAESIAQITATKPAIILVAYGMMKQDWWSVRNLSKSGAQVSIGVGGVFDYLAGKSKLAPQWMRRVGLEWLYRLWQEPWRWRRIMVAVPWFGSAVLLEVLRKRLRI